MDNVIDWKLLSSAINFYTCMDFRYLEVPWMVPTNVAEITLPVNEPERLIKTIGHDALVGSAEQSFLYLEKLSPLAKGRYVACTPCFRNEPIIDDIHRKCFMKVELYSTLFCDIENEITLMKIAEQFFSQTTSKLSKLKLVMI